jgi:ABC-2 type transport system permease protein
MSDTMLSRRPAVTTAATPGPAARPTAPLRDASTMIGRGLRLSRRNVEALITSLMLPVALLLMFVYLFGGAIRVNTTYATYVVPGVILICAAFGSATTAVVVSQDMHSGVIDRFRSMDVGATAMIAGHVTASVVRNLAATAIVMGLGLAVGFRPHASLWQWLVAAGLLLLFMTAISWLAASCGLLVSSPEAANGYTFIFMFVPYASSAFVPISTMPAWLHGFARNQPCTPIIEAIRTTLAGHPSGSSVARALLWCTGLLCIGMLGSVFAFRRRTT